MLALYISGKLQILSKTLLHGEIMKNFLLAFILFSPSQVFGNELPQTIDFRHFLYEFFNDSEFQIKHVKDPYLYIYYSSDEMDAGLLKENRNLSTWEHLIGPEHYRCKQNCFDLVIYDNFDNRHKESGERTLAFEGVENGINEVLYFELIDSEWYLVKYESLSN